MNLIGKIFIVLIFVMALVFMSLTLALYATHTNWREANQELQSQLASVRAERDDFRTRRDRLQEQFDALDAEKRESLTKLENERVELVRQLEQLEQGLGQAQEEVREAVAAMQATQQSAQKALAERDEIRADLRQAQLDRDESFARMVRTSDELNQHLTELNRLRGRQVTLAGDLSRARDLLRAHDIDPDIDPALPDEVRGFVVATLPSGLIEISIGTDDGIRESHELEAFRVANGTSTYLGRVTVMRSEPHRAVCRILPEYRRGPISEGDLVASRVRLTGLAGPAGAPVGGDF